MRVRTPVEGFTGIVAGVEFVDGVGEVDDSDMGAVAYFRRHGYDVGGEAADVPEPVDPRDVGGGSGVVTVGTRLRDGAVDPHPGDFLAPTNAGQANPHGPQVVAPEIHASEGVRPVKGGDVHVDDPTVQDAAETAHTEAHLGAEVSRPPRSAKVEQWRSYAEAVDPDRDDLASMTKADLIATYGQEEEG